MSRHSRSNPRNANSFKRKVNNRDERVCTYSIAKIVISFKDFVIDSSQKDLQTFSSWETEKILSQLNDKLVHLTRLTMNEAKNQGFIKEYKNFPKKTDFKCPDNLKNISSWATINRISGQKCRIAGYIEDNVFYIVFLDKNHRFYITEKKGT